MNTAKLLRLPDVLALTASTRSTHYQASATGSPFGRVRRHPANHMPRRRLSPSKPPKQRRCSQTDAVTEALLTAAD
ncbi:MAG: hypothetical protein IPG13_09095 [Rhodocyclaceae bacterium]|nr:hypothetical protein [Rhodocyclaceae bacterium]